MRLSFLGTGSTSAPPLYGCDCEICVEARGNPRMRRRPASALVEAGETRLLIDAGLPPKTEVFLRDWQPSALVIDCSHPPRPEPQKNHNDVLLALAVIAVVQPQRAWLTHIGHELDAWLKEHGCTLSPGVFVACDGESVHDPLDIRTK